MSRIHNVHEESSSEDENFNINSIHKADTREEIFTRIKARVPKKEHVVMNLRVKLDTGGNANILTLRSFKQMYPENVTENDEIINADFVTKSKTKLIGYSGEKINNIGTMTIKCGKDRIPVPQVFFITKTDGPNILSLQGCRALDLVKINCNISDNTTVNSVEDLKTLFPGQFDTLGSFQNNFHIQIDKNATPVVQPPRKYPVHIKNELKQELDRMESLNVIRKETEPTDWVNSIAFSRKSNGKLKLTTFSSPFGRYRFLRLPFGLSVSQDIFQFKMVQILEKGEGTLEISDDVCVYGETEEEHDRNLLNLLKVCKERGLVFNSDKCYIKQPQISFYGLIWDENGVHPDPQKCDNIKEKQAPTSVKELQQFLGMIQYMSPFISNLSTYTDPPRKLLHKNSEWQWTSHEEAFQKIKNLVHKRMTLNYFNTEKATTIEVDSSLVGMGAALIQEGRPIAFASKSMTETESRYANIERELLTVVFALERFHTYVYGKHVTIFSDHKPLENIQYKNLAKAPPMLQRLLLRIQPYNITIVHKPGKDMIFADYLSRVNPTPGEEIELDAVIHQVSISDEKYHALKEETAKDTELACLKSQIIVGWPDEAKEVPQAIKKYWSMRDYLSY
ncbi:transposon ty3-i Gag-Pol polyprotein [Plakobranchus ocellatus]|uniref:Transposon ty3-i Gag-Pol polyprotein n=1 Tax=Plakobranchus ocellatus TaxID=259542 RepID=A0AAV4CCN8_9GAST|nr:transposon ty3-i Gag-Pol polyprotein [Plakobranchus ocellatus]